MTGLTFRERLKVPSAAVIAMCDGLQQIPKAGRFCLDMRVYLETRGSWPSRRICHGCAATCAVLQTLRIPVPKKCWPSETEPMSHVRARLYGVDASDLKRFEIAIDTLRMGVATWLLRYFEIAQAELHDECRQLSRSLPHIENYVPPRTITTYLNFAAQLQRLGI